MGHHFYALVQLASFFFFLKLIHLIKWLYIVQYCTWVLEVQYVLIKKHRCSGATGIFIIIIFFLRNKTLESNVWFMCICPELNWWLTFKVYSSTPHPLTVVQSRTPQSLITNYVEFEFSPFFAFFFGLSTVLKTIPSLYWEWVPGVLFYFSKERRKPTPASHPYSHITSGHKDGSQLPQTDCFNPLSGRSGSTLC